MDYSHVDSFNSPSHFQDFIHRLKPKLLAGEIGIVHGGLERFPYPIDEDTFDKCFRLTVIPKMEIIEQLYNIKPGDLRSLE